MKKLKEVNEIFTLAIDVISFMELTKLYIEEDDLESKAVALKYAIIAQRKVVDYLDSIS